MPPRTRKAAAAAPDPKQPGGEVTADTAPLVAEQGPEAAVSEVTGHVRPAAEATKSSAADTVTGGNVKSQEPIAFGDGDPEEFAPANVTSGRQGVAVPSFHWQTPSGALGTPCRLCAPAGPPAGAGSFGCGHGQWVRVQDAA